MQIREAYAQVHPKWRAEGYARVFSAKVVIRLRVLGVHPEGAGAEATALNLLARFASVSPALAFVGNWKLTVAEIHSRQFRGPLRLKSQVLCCPALPLEPLGDLLGKSETSCSLL